ncbi:MAG TPA: gliding motility protein GldM [Edaphocola sp.]|nr:gliding motility protein GldM [Edaphocola sp.]
MAGTSNVPESRQLMINLMYLVLTALLALNVTREVLNAFGTMNKSIVRSNQSIDKKSDEIYNQLDAEALTSDSLKVKPWNIKAHAIKARTEALVKYLEGWKDSLIKTSGGYMLGDAGDSIIRGMDNINTTTDLFVNRKYGARIQDSMQTYINYALGMVDSIPIRNNMAAQFPLKISDKLPKTEENPSGDWSYGTFHNIPVIAGVAMLSKFQNDIKNSESMILEYFQRQVHAKDYKFNALQAIAVPNTTYALEGQPIEATIMLAAYNKDATGMSISSTAGNVPVSEGVGHLKFNASGVGMKTVNGVITVQKDGKPEPYKFSFDYMVGTAGASLQLDKMNVMYIGVPNPITLSASGYNIEDVSLAWDAGSGVTMKPTGKGQYDVTVSKQGTVGYKIMAKKREGGLAQVGGGQIRMKRIPDPVAEIGRKSGGLIPTGDAKAQSGVAADLKNFEFDARFVVTGFVFTWIPLNGQPLTQQNTGPYFNQTVKQYIDRSKPGDTWMITNVKARGPAGDVRDLSPVVLKLN